VDTSTDLRQQALREGLDKVDAVLFTHPHADHVNGIDDLRGFYFLHKEVIPCYASPETFEILSAGFRYIFFEFNGSGYSPLLSPHVISGPFELFGLTITPVPLEHGKGTALGFRIGKFAYLTDCSALPDSSLLLLEGLNVLVIDGLRWTPHPFHFNIEAAIAAVEPIKPARVVLTHLTHEVSHSEQAKLPPGFEFAYDGMVFDVV
jgi:phosphoribosyl 1,2-cyclic phosphate phosphodiesterase